LEIASAIFRDGNPRWSTQFPKEYDPDSPDGFNSCPGHASWARLY
jgi:hypothetical protein